MGQIKLRFSFWLKINFRKIASNKHVDLRKIENFVWSKCYPEGIPKIKGKKANFRKSLSLFLKMLKDLTSVYTISSITYMTATWTGYQNSCSQVLCRTAEFWKISLIFIKKSMMRGSNFIKNTKIYFKRIPSQVFSFELRIFFYNRILAEHLWTTTSVTFWVKVQKDFWNITVNHKNLQASVTETFKVKNDLAPDIMKDAFELKERTTSWCTMSFAHDIMVLKERTSELKERTTSWCTTSFAHDIMVTARVYMIA